jgi:hypothetical protein
VTDTEGADGADGTGTGTPGSEAGGRTGADADAGRSCRALLSRGASWVIVASPGSGAAG